MGTFSSGKDIDPLCIVNLTRVPDTNELSHEEQRPTRLRLRGVVHSAEATVIWTPLPSDDSAGDDEIE